MSAVSAFTGQIYTAPPERVERMTRAVLRWLAPERQLRILEIGCGTGSQLLSLAEALPQAELVGVDISEQCIRQAREAQVRTTHGERLQFLAGNYTETPLPGGFDAILADSVLHLMETTDESLLAKLAADLLPGGLLLMTIPYGCLYNHLLWFIRRCFRLARSSWTDQFVLMAARKMHRHDMSENLLRERIQYMYLLPHRYWGRRLQRQFREIHVEAVESSPVPHASLAQPKHCLCVCRKSAGGSQR